TLNRPKALNALTHPMCLMMIEALENWRNDDDVKAIVVDGAGEKGFCAGGDILKLHDSGKAGNDDAWLFWRDEYRLNTLIFHYPKPYVALIDGITMGGGVGVSVHGRYRVCTENTVFAMPETGIGLLPDVGGTYFLPRLPGFIGTYMVLTGARLRAADLYYTGIATHYMPSAQLEKLKQELAAGCDIEETLAGFHADSVVDIWAALGAADTDWARKQIDIINTKSPTSSAVALRQMRDGAKADFNGCMQIEMRAVTRLMALPDFYEGVRAVILDKDNAPSWTPPEHANVAAADIDKIFASLGADELQLGGKNA
ncbi:MAG: enoyl-CoA hydratase/isomerase family protein, partial [Pseudomonadota bacterium]|nr:enoyl-CoA hydratase/isomerase family protein [Pseudomonadota bacterium]